MALEDNSIGALDEFENEIDGVLGRGVELRLPCCDNERVDIRRSHEGLDDPISLLFNSTS